MSMTREEAIAIIERLAHTEAKWPGTEDTLEALDMALSALRPVSREQVERIWFREPYSRLETRHGDDGGIVYSAVNTCMACGQETPIGNFCHNCGAAQTREAVKMVMERMNKLHD